MHFSMLPSQHVCAVALRSAIYCAVPAIRLSAVVLMSLRAQLQAPSGNNRPIIAATLNADQMHDSSRCNAVLWAPRSNGSQFLACHASGSILVYKKVWCSCYCRIVANTVQLYLAAARVTNPGVAAQQQPHGTFMAAYLYLCVRYSLPICVCCRATPFNRNPFHTKHSVSLAPWHDRRRFRRAVLPPVRPSVVAAL
jgi:hypothetical protein